jgi:hypothetical protein
MHDRGGCRIVFIVLADADRVPDQNLTGAVVEKARTQVRRYGWRKRSAAIRKRKTLSSAACSWLRSPSLSMSIDHRTPNVFLQFKVA